MRRPALVCLGIVLTALASGCGTGSTPVAQQQALASPHALAVQPALDTATKDQAVPATGGAVTVTGSDGTVFTLTIPDGALMGPEKITMTAVKSISDLPFSGGLQAAVQLEPSGLQLFKPATLVIKPAKTVPLTSQVGFAYHGSGKELFMYPLAPTAALTIRVVHFSGYGAASATSSDIQRQLQNIPTAAEDQTVQQITGTLYDLLAKERQSQMSGNPPSDDLANRVGDFEKRDFDRIVKPLLERATSDLSLVDYAIYAALSWLRQAALWGLDESRFKAESDYIHQKIGELLDKAEKDAIDRCLNKKDPAYAQRMLFLERARQLFGLAPTPDIFDKVEKCLTFKLDFSTNDPFLYDAYPHSAEFGMSGLMVHAQQKDPVTKDEELKYFGPYSHADSPFTYQNPHMTKPLTVFSLDLYLHYDYDPTSNSNPPPKVSDVVLWFNPGEGEVTFATVGGGPDDTPTSFMTGRDNTGFKAWHVDELYGERYNITSWKIDSSPGSWVATKTYDREIVIGGVDWQMAEKTKLTLTFAPGA